MRELFFVLSVNGYKSNWIERNNRCVYMCEDEVQIRRELVFDIENFMFFKIIFIIKL